MSQNWTDQPAPIRYAVAVKGPKGRKWYDTASGQGAYEFVQQLAEAYAADYQHLRFSVRPAHEVVDIAPIEYRPWAEEGDDVDEDVHADELATADL